MPFNGEIDANSITPKELIASLIAALPDPVLVLDSRANVVTANQSAHVLFNGLRDDEALVFAIRVPSILDAVTLVLSGAERQIVQWHERTPVERLFDVFITPYKINEQRAVVVEFRDITEARRVERMRVNFIANVSHELRTPLTSLLGFVETLQGPAREDPEARKKFLDIMGDQARRMARLVDDLMALSHIELKEHLRPQAPVDLVAIVRHTLDTLEPTAKEAGFSIAIECPAQAFVSGDRDELIRMAENLIKNAIKYGVGNATETASIFIQISAQRGDVVFSVRDNGMGIAEEHLPRLTERFYRVNTPISRARGGTGLGLAIVKHIVARHRGKLEIESEIGQGSTFRVIIPSTNSNAQLNQ